ncbi:amidohydrolase family protein [Streptomyces rectiviolaceus]|uniref:Amidohydrolase-related domain-containing protein n=1 Tax=Streptomyces rectiviolaceus TaxID=332591 RepID=A0ABP6MUY7_9ACTN
MIDNMFVIDATVHPYNLAEENLNQAPGGGPDLHAFALREMLWGMHERFATEGSAITREAFCTDWSPELLARTMFTESDVDLAVNHRLRIDSVFQDGLCNGTKNQVLADKWPQRVIPYAGLNPMLGVDACMRDLRQQVADVPGTIGIKVYPNSGSPDASWRLDDPEFDQLFVLAKELGIKIFAVHKIIPNGLVPLKPFGIDDLETVAIRHIDLSFEIVHAGLPPFVEEVAMALMRLPNVYANLEITSAILAHGMGYVEDALAQLISLGGAEKIIYASGAMHFHPQPVLEKMARLTFPDQLLERYGIEQITHEQRAGFLAGNFARIAGIDLAAAEQAVRDDEFARERAAHGGNRPMWSHWRATQPELWNAAPGAAA